MTTTLRASRLAAGLCTDCPQRNVRPAVQRGLCAEHFAADLVQQIRSDVRRLDRYKMLRPSVAAYAEPDCDDAPPDTLTRGVARGYVEVDVELLAG